MIMSLVRWLISGCTHARGHRQERGIELGKTSIIGMGERINKLEKISIFYGNWNWFLNQLRLMNQCIHLLSNPKWIFCSLERNWPNIENSLGRALCNLNLLDYQPPLFLSLWLLQSCHPYCNSRIKKSYNYVTSGDWFVVATGQIWDAESPYPRGLGLKVKRDMHSVEVWPVRNSLWPHILVFRLGKMKKQ